MTHKLCRLALIAATVLSATEVHAADPPATDLEQRLEQQVSQMQQQLDAVTTQLQQLKAQNEALAAAQQQQAAQAQVVRPPPRRRAASRRI